MIKQEYKSPLLIFNLLGSNPIKPLKIKNNKIVSVIKDGMRVLNIPMNPNCEIKSTTHKEPPNRKYEESNRVNNNFSFPITDRLINTMDS